MSDDQQRHNDNIVHYEGGIPVFNTRLNKLENDAREAKDRDDKYKQEQLKLNRRLAWFTGLLAAVGLVESAISVYQAHVTKINSDAARDNASAAQGMVEEMKHARSQAALDSAKAISAQQGIAQDSLAKSQENFERGTENSRDSFRDDQRAWVGPENTVVDQFDSKKPFKGRIQFFNRGKTPARAVQITTSYMLSPTYIAGPSPEEFRKTATFQGNSIISPQGAQTVVADGSSRGMIRTIVSPLQQASAHYEEIRRRAMFFYIFGEVKYNDVSDRQHATKYCYFLTDISTSVDDPPNWQLGYCDVFNDMN